MNLGSFWEFVKRNWKLLLAIVYLLVPFDFIPDFIPLLGVSDDLIFLLLTLLMSYLEYKKSPTDYMAKRRGTTSKIVDGEIVE